MTERPIVNVDMDGVLADFDQSVEDRLRIAKPEIIIPSREGDFYIARRLNLEDAALAMEIQAREGFFRGLRPIEGAIEGWHAIADFGYHPRILSAPLRSNLWCTAEKLAWLDEYFGPRVVDEAIITKEKTLYGGIALIDDRPTITDASHASWQHILFTQPYNQQIKTDFRLNDWSDTTQLRTLLARCAGRLS